MFILLAFAALIASPFWLLAVVVKLISAALPGRRTARGVHLMRWCAAMAAVAAVGIYVMGLGAVQFATNEAESGANSSPAPACRATAPGNVEDLSGHRPSYLPLRFDCVLDDGTTYPSSSSYGWLNVLTIGFGASAVVLVAAGRLAAEHRVPDRAGA